MSGDGFGRLTAERDCAAVFFVKNPASFLGILMHSSAFLFGKRDRGREGSSALDPGGNQQDSPPETGERRCGEFEGESWSACGKASPRGVALGLNYKKLVTQ